MKTSRSLRHAVLALTAMSTFSLLGCGGCASHEQSQAQAQGKTAQAQAQNSEKSRKPVVWELSAEAQATYAYLLYDQALRQEDEGMFEAALQALLPFNPPVQCYIEAGVWLMGRRSPDTLALVEKGLQRFPADISLNLLKAETLQDTGKVDEAIAHMRAYSAAQPNSIDARLELALLLGKAGKHHEAENLLKGIPAKQRTALVEYYHARALLGMKRNNEAMGHLQKALKLMPEFVEAMAELAYIHEQRQEFNEARALYEKLYKHNDAGQEVLLRLIAISLRMNQPQKAMEYVKRGPATGAFQASVANMFVEARQYAQAEPLLLGLINSPDAPADLYFYLAAVAYEGQKSVPKALEWLEKIHKGHPSYSRALLLRVQLLADGGKLEDALKVVQTGQQAAPDQKDFWSMQVRLLAGLKRQDEALKVADAMMARWPDDGDLAFLQASLLEDVGRKGAALKAMEAIVAKHPNHYQALNYVGYTLAEENRDLERALTLLHKAVELAPKSDYILDSLAWALFRAGRMQDAWKTISEAVSANPAADPAIWEHYADIALALGKTAEARKGYYKALEHKPANAESLRERLSQL